MWRGENLYEEDAPREKLIEIIKWYAKEVENIHKQHEEDLEWLAPTKTDKQ